MIPAKSVANPSVKSFVTRAVSPTPSRRLSATDAATPAGLVSTRCDISSGVQNVEDDTVVYLFASIGDTNAHFCSTEAEGPGIAQAYTLSVDIQNINSVLGADYGHIGIGYNVIDDSNYDFVYFRPLGAMRRGGRCLQVGYVDSGIPSFEPQNDCHGGQVSSGTWFNVKIKVTQEAAGSTANIFKNDVLQTTVLRTHFSSRLAGNMIVYNGYNNEGYFKNFSIQTVCPDATPSPTAAPTYEPVTTISGYCRQASRGLASPGSPGNEGGEVDQLAKDACIAKCESIADCVAVEVMNSGHVHCEIWTEVPTGSDTIDATGECILMGGVVVPANFVSWCDDGDRGRPQVAGQCTPYEEQATVFAGYCRQSGRVSEMPEETRDGVDLVSFHAKRACIERCKIVSGCKAVEVLNGESSSHCELWTEVPSGSETKDGAGECILMGGVERPPGFEQWCMNLEQMRESAPGSMDYYVPRPSGSVEINGVHQGCIHQVVVQDQVHVQVACVSNDECPSSSCTNGLCDLAGEDGKDSR
jgi:hypothetical protein